MGKHRRPNRIERTSTRAAGVAALTATGVLGSLAAVALAAQSGVDQAGFVPTVINGGSMANRVEAQATTQEQAAEEAAARKKTVEDVARASAVEKGEQVREAEQHAAREAERMRLLSYGAPISGSYISTGYQASGSLWSSGSHTGVDFHAASGTSVHAVGAGTVVEAGWGGSYGNQIVIKMNDDTYTQYGHLSSIGVSVGQAVTPGQRIGLSGATGNVTGPHLHFEARTSPEYGSDIDPVAYLRSHGVNV
ncbi:murein DD-endopeptidase MepM/ murein hydrolase activator NlpD [Streptomyces sp. V4I8]